MNIRITETDAIKYPLTIYYPKSNPYIYLPKFGPNAVKELIRMAIKNGKQNQIEQYYNICSPFNFHDEIINFFSSIEPLVF